MTAARASRRATCRSSSSRSARAGSPHDAAVSASVSIPSAGLEGSRGPRAGAAHAATRLIALTGYGKAEDMRQALKAGFEAHLTKPVNLEQLMALLTSVSR